MTDLSIVIPTFNRRETLEPNLEACFRFSRGLDAEFIVIDDGSSDGTAEYLAGLTPNETTLKHESISNGGPARARNIGASLATGKLLLFLGDDIRPLGADFFRTHLRLHDRLAEQNVAVLGKVVWPMELEFPITFAMTLIQGDGGQQFGYAHMRPYASYDWRFFYTANVSIKRACVHEWESDGFSQDFRSAAYEDGEFAYRLERRFGEFHIVYAPTSVGAHFHSYSVQGFIRRQISAGMMANIFAEKHPKTTQKLGLADIYEAIRRPFDAEDELLQPDYLAVIEGIFASARLLDRSQQLGRFAWHTPFANAVFALAYHKGIILSHPEPTANRSAAYRKALDIFDENISRIVEVEHIPSTAPWSTLKRR